MNVVYLKLKPVQPRWLRRVLKPSTLFLFKMDPLNNSLDEECFFQLFLVALLYYVSSVVIHEYFPWDWHF